MVPWCCEGGGRRLVLAATTNSCSRQGMTFSDAIFAAFFSISPIGKSTSFCSSSTSASSFSSAGSTLLFFPMLEQTEAHLGCVNPYFGEPRATGYLVLKVPAPEENCPELQTSRSPLLRPYITEWFVTTNPTDAAATAEVRSRSGCRGDMVAPGAGGAR